jgi:serine/threonine protein kinase
MHCAACGAHLPDDAGAPCSTCGGDPVLQGRFVLLDPIGSGAHGTTWRATDAATGAIVAVKELPLRLGAPDKVVALFRREAEVLRQLDHPAIPTWIDAFEAGQGRQRALWIAMDFVDGHTLADELDRRRYSEDEVLDILQELCEILDYLHGRQPPVVHRDLKLGNVIRRPSGRLAIVDFGSVRDAVRCADLGGSTVAGTFGYMAPEQFAGDAEPRSDLYAIGAIGAHLLTRRAPHTLQRPGKPMDFEPHVALSPAAARLLRGLVALDPQDRPASAEAVAARIQAIRAGEDPEVAVPAVQPTPAVPPTPAKVPAAPVVASPSPPARRPAPVSTVGDDPTWVARRRPPTLLTDELRLTVHSRRPLEARDEAAIVDAIADTVGLDGNGQLTEGGYRWRARVRGRDLRLAIDNEGVGARIRVIEDHTAATAGILFGLGGGIIGGVGGGVGWLFFAEWGALAGTVFLAGLAGATVLAAVGVARTTRRVRDQRSVELAAALQARLGGAAAGAPALVSPPERTMYWGAAAVVAATVWVLMFQIGLLLGPWWIALILLFVGFGGWSKARARSIEDQAASRGRQSVARGREPAQIPDEVESDRVEAARERAPVEGERPAGRR